MTSASDLGDLRATRRLIRDSENRRRALSDRAECLHLAERPRQVETARRQEFTALSLNQHGRDRGPWQPHAPNVDLARTLTFASAEDSGNAGSGGAREPSYGGSASDVYTVDVGGSADSSGLAAGETGSIDPRPACVGEPSERRCTVSGGSFRLGPVEAPVPSDVSSFQLDELEVTVGRFRKFVTSFRGAPEAGAGAHPEIEHSGWRSEWNAHLPASIEPLLASLHCNADWQTWSDEPDEREDYPLTCASYYVAFAYCAWNGGRLPTEAEWEYAASGGAEQRVYPWGDDEPSFELASFRTSAIAKAGTHRPGMARFGQLDLAGSAWEWTLDLYRSYPESCAHCAELERGVERVLRGGAFLNDSANLKTCRRFHTDPQLTLGDVGFRCAY